MITSRPIIASVLLFALFVGVPYSIIHFFFDLKTSALVCMLYHLIPTSVLIWFIMKLQLSRETGLSVPIQDWNARWWIWLIVFIAIFESPLILGIKLDNMTFSMTRLSHLFSDCFIVGLKEELLDRGIMFFLLLSLWGNNKRGIVAAFLAQAILFGLGHYINAFSANDLNSVHAQVIGTTYYGLAFGGIYVITRSIWPSAFAHGLHNAIVGFNSTFGNSEPSVGPTLSSEMIFPLIFTGLLFLIFGMICLMKSKVYTKAGVQMN